MKFCGDIAKFDSQADGSLIIEGIASTEDIDRQGDIVDAEAIRKALPEYLKAPSIREMHNPIAAGKTLSAFVDDDGKTHITAKIVDAGTITKIKEGVLRAFSIGGRSLSKLGNKITSLVLDEISVVDKGANPACLFSICKFDRPAPVTEPKKTMYKPELLKALGLDDKATEEAVQEAMIKRLVTPTPAPDEARFSKMDNSIKELGETLKKVLETSTAQADAAVKAQKDSIIAEASRDGKVIPLDNEDIAKMDVGTFKKMVDKLPKGQVPLKKSDSTALVDEKGTQLTVRNTEPDKLAKVLSSKRSEGINRLDAWFKSQSPATI